MKKLFKIPDGYRFSNKYIITYLLPILFEQLLIASLNIVDTFMISRLPNSDYALAGIANVSRLDTMCKQIFVALAAGGAIFVAQYLGARRREEANRALKHGVYSLFAIAVILAALLEIFKVPILNFLFGKVEERVMEQSLSYYSMTILAYPFMALFNSGTASLRSMGKTKITFYSSVALLSINIALKYVFLFHFNMGVFGAGLSLMIAYAIIGIFLFIRLLSPKNPAHIDKPLNLKLSFPLLGKIYAVALPTGIENGLFQIGALILQTLVASLGTAAINANHLTTTLTPLTHSFAGAFTLGVLPLVSQCMGANSTKEAEFYARYIVRINHIFLALLAAIVIPLSPMLVSIFGYDAETSRTAVICLWIYFGATPFLYPESFAIPGALRGAGDTKYTMVVAISTMFLFRIGFAYLLVYAFDAGVLAIWIAMVSDWVFRTILFKTRFERGKWKNHNLIHN